MTRKYQTDSVFFHPQNIMSLGYIRLVQCIIIHRMLYGIPDWYSLLQYTEYNMTKIYKTGPVYCHIQNVMVQCIIVHRIYKSDWKRVLSYTSIIVHRIYCDKDISVVQFIAIN